MRRRSRDIDVVNATFVIMAEGQPDEAAAHARRYIEDVHQNVLQAVVRWPSAMTSEVIVLSTS